MIASFNVAPADVTPGGQADFTTEITNTGDAVLDVPLTISVDYAAGAKGTIGTPTATKGTVSVTGNNVSWDGTLAKGENMTVSVPVEVGSDATVGGTITATLQPPSGWEVEGTATATTTVTAAAKASLVLDNTTTSTAVIPDTEYDHVAKIENTGDADWTGGKIEIDFISAPQGSSTVVSASADKGNATVDGSVVSWAGNITKGTSVTVTTVAKFDAEATDEATQKSSIQKPAGVDSTGTMDATATCVGSQTFKRRK